MDNNNLISDVKRSLNNTSVGELTPGSVGRRWEPRGGVSKHNERIHKESKYIDDHKNLPFTFSKPKKNQINKLVKCMSCGHVTYASKNTVGVICSECKKYSEVEEVHNNV